MRHVRKKSYGPERLRVDETTFEDCEFHGTTLVFGGGGMPVFRGGTFAGIALDFDGAALETIKFLRQLVLMGGQELVFAQFRLAGGARH